MISFLKAVATHPEYLPPIGGIFAERYVIEQPLGQGGMAYVMRARDAETDEQVAIKCMLPHLVNVPEAGERFLREARIASSLRNPHVVRVVDVGVDAREVPFMAMEYLDGKTVEAVLEKKKRFDIVESVRMTRELCLGLAEAHRKGVVHRDVKPVNLYLVDNGEEAPTLKILDFGISKLVNDELSLTRDASYMGSPHYTAPEQIISTKNVDHRADIWSAGVCLYRYLTGVRPFDAQQIWEIANRVVKADPVRIETLRPDIPPELADLVHRCLEKAPADRFQTANDVVHALDHLDLTAVEVTEESDVVTHFNRPLPLSSRRSRDSDAAPSVGSQREPHSGSAAALNAPADTSDQGAMSARGAMSLEAPPAGRRPSAFPRISSAPKPLVTTVLVVISALLVVAFVFARGSKGRVGGPGEEPSASVLAPNEPGSNEVGPDKTASSESGKAAEKGTPHATPSVSAGDLPSLRRDPSTARPRPTGGRTSEAKVPEPKATAEAKTTAEPKPTAEPKKKPGVWPPETR